MICSWLETPSKPAVFPLVRGAVVILSKRDPRSGAALGRGGESVPVLGVLEERSVGI